MIANNVILPIGTLSTCIMWYSWDNELNYVLRF